jgi:hypothetical protein
MALRNAAALLTLAATADAHGALVSPPPRNAIDRVLAPWNGPVPAKTPTVESKTGWCPVPDKDGKPSGQNGQACFCTPSPLTPPPLCQLPAAPSNKLAGAPCWPLCQCQCQCQCQLHPQQLARPRADLRTPACPPACAGFSNGCAIGCKTCDGFSRGPIPWGSFKGNPYWDRKFNLCPVGAANSTQVAGKPTATICDPGLRTLNVNTSCGANDDWYYYSPWRAPGSAPVMDSWYVSVQPAARGSLA